MGQGAIIECAACRRDFPAAMPLDRASLARSGLMFMVETCPHCSESQSYFKAQYRFAPRPAPVTG